MNQVFITFCIAILGYLIGRIRICGLQLGSSAVLLVALLFGHFSLETPVLIRDMGLVFFVASVGFIAGPVFFENFKRHATIYTILGITIIATGSFVCIVSIKAFGVPSELAVGLMTGALTCTPGLAAVIEASGSDTASIGYGIAYPFGVVGVVLFVQLLPKLFDVDIVAEALKMDNTLKDKETETDIPDSRIVIDHFGFFAFSLAVIIGKLVAAIHIPLPGGVHFSLSNSGGPLLAGLILGHYKHIGPISLRVPTSTLRPLCELGLILFLIGAGTGAGKGLVEIVRQQGAVLFVHGIVMTLLPMIVGFFVAYLVMKMSMLETLGAICGGMTSTPALGTLISSTGSDAVASSFASTYPTALICMILASEFIYLLL